MEHLHNMGIQTFLLRMLLKHMALDLGLYKHMQQARSIQIYIKATALNFFHGIHIPYPIRVLFYHQPPPPVRKGHRQWNLCIALVLRQHLGI